MPSASGREHANSAPKALHRPRANSKSSSALNPRPAATIRLAAARLTSATSEPSVATTRAVNPWPVMVSAATASPSHANPPSRIATTGPANATLSSPMPPYTARSADWDCRETNPLRMGAFREAATAAARTRSAGRFAASTTSPAAAGTAATTWGAKASAGTPSPASIWTTLSTPVTATAPTVTATASPPIV